MAKQKKFYDTQAFKQTQKDWYAKLKLCGFNDLETESQNIWAKKQNISDQYENHFDACRDYLNEAEFENELDKLIFEKHCEGLSVREIETFLKETEHKSLRKTAIAARIEKTLVKAGISSIAK